MTIGKGSDFEQFDLDWLQLGREICQIIYTNPRVQEIKHSLQKNGFLSMDEKSEFINLCDSIKYQTIYAKFGQEDSEGYKAFSEQWKNWFQLKGVGSAQNKGQRNNVEHILFNSTPDPEQFLLHFEHEILGSMKASE